MIMTKRALFLASCTLAWATAGAQVVPTETLGLRDAVERLLGGGQKSIEFLGDQGLRDAFQKAGGPPSRLVVKLAVEADLTQGCKRFRLAVRAPDVRVPKPGQDPESASPVVSTSTFSACPAGVRPPVGAPK